MSELAVQDEAVVSPVDDEAPVAVVEADVEVVEADAEVEVATEVAVTKGGRQYLSEEKSAEYHEKVAALIAAGWTRPRLLILLNQLPQREDHERLPWVDSMLYRIRPGFPVRADVTTDLDDLLAKIEEEGLQAKPRNAQRAALERLDTLTTIVQLVNSRLSSVVDTRSIKELKATVQDVIDVLTHA